MLALSNNAELMNTLTRVAPAGLGRPLTGCPCLCDREGRPFAASQIPQCPI